MRDIVLTTPDELRAIISEAIDGILPRLYDFRPAPKPAPERMGMRDALEFLAAQGYPTTEKSVYGLVHARAIPFRKVGHRLVFFRSELAEWVNARMTTPEDVKRKAGRA